MADTPRDPFAKPGQPGNRKIQYGTDGSIPKKHRATIEQGILLAYRLTLDDRFVGIFQDTVSKLGGKKVGKSAYGDALDKMVIHHAETSKNPVARKELADIVKARRQDRKYQAPLAFSVVGGRDVWLRSPLIQSKNPKLVAGTLMHEAAHLAGAPGDLLAEVVLWRLNQASGYPRG